MLTITPQRILFTAIAAVCLGLIVSHLLANNSHTISIDQGEGTHSIDRDEYMSSLARTASNILPKISRNTTTSPKMASLTHAKITTRPSSTRGTANHGWLDTKHSFSFASWHDPRYMSFGSLRVLNEDRVAPQTGFPTHPHRDAEIFSYILSGELTHRDSLQRRGQESTTNKDQFYRMKRGDVQFTTGGRGIAHSEQNEHARDWVHFLQIWVLPWKKGLTPIYHTETFGEEAKRQNFVEIVTPLKAGPEATAEEEKAAVPASKGSIPIHADLVFAAGIIAPGRKFEYRVGGSCA